MPSRPEAPTSNTGNGAKRSMLPFALAGLAITLAFVVVLGTLAAERARDSLRNRFAGEVAHAASQLSLAVERRAGLVHGLVAHVEATVRMEGNESFTGDEEDFRKSYEVFASRLPGDVTGIRNLALARDFVVTQVYPRSGNERVLGYDLRTDDRPVVRQAYRRMLGARSAVIQTPTGLVQGGKGLVTRHIVHMPDGTAWGAVAVVADLAPILAEAGLCRAGNCFKYEIADDNGLTFHSNADGLDRDPLRLVVPVSDGRWWISATPSAGWANVERQEVLIAYGAVGLVGTLLFALVMALIAHRRRLVEIEKAREALAETDGMRRSLIQGIPDLIFRVSVNGVYLDVHAPDPTQLTHPASELVGKHVTEVLPPEVARDRQRAIREAHRTGRVQRVTYEVLIAGEPRQFEATISPKDDNEVIIMSREVTGRRNMERELRFTAQRLSEAERLAGAGHWSIEYPSMTFIISKEASNIVGTWGGPQPTSFESLVDRVHEDDREAFLTARQKWEMGAEPGEPEQPVVLEHRVVRPSGEVRMVRTSVQLVRDERGQRVRIIGGLQDISSAKARESELRAARDEAETASRTKSEFLANMSHELRTPLNAIIGFSDILRSQLLGPLGNSRYTEYAEDIHTSGSHLLELINDILDISKIEAGGIKLSEETFDLRRCLLACERMVRERAAMRGHTLIVSVGDSLPELYGDERYVKQIVINLLTNAIKYTPEYGQITLDVDYMIQGPVTITVRDNGIGIADHHLDHVMEPFGQAEGAMQRSTEGTGLGLPLAKALIELHGGELVLESKLDVGTSVSVRFPRERVVHGSFAPAL
ncbi:MAG: ATP-binding protein [Magnetovibrionaceae bacterium]